MAGSNLKSQDISNLIRCMNVFDLKCCFGAEYYVDTTGYPAKFHKDSAIFVHMYYEETVDDCFSFIKKTGNVCDIYITTSNHKLKAVLELKIHEEGINNCKIRLIENRGRDIASLVIYNRHLISKYKYFCFVHDKRSNHLNNMESGMRWLWTLWENTLASPEYVCQIIDLLDSNERLGILSVPEPFWGEFVSVVGNAWNDSYKDVIALIKKLKSDCVISYEKPPIMIGTAFWAKTDALKPLFEYNFTPDDFPEEGVGALSYAVERIFPYIAQSQGYYTGIVATKEYAAKRTIYIQSALATTVSVLQHRYCWNNLTQINCVARIYERIDSLLINYPYVYIYGTGKISSEFIMRYPAIINKIRGFVVSNGKKQDHFFKEKKIYELEEISDLKESAFIIAVQEKFCEEIINHLVKKRVTEQQFLCAGDLIKEID